MKKIIFVFLVLFMAFIPARAQNYSLTHEQKYYCGSEYGRVSCTAVYSTSNNVRWTHAWNSLPVTCKAISATETGYHVNGTELKTSASILVTSNANSASSGTARWKFTYSSGNVTWTTY